MGRRGTVLAGLVVGTLALAACAGGGDRDLTVEPGGDPGEHGLHVGAGSRVPVSLADAAAASSVVDATWRAGFLALRASDETTGTVASPASLVVALAMLAEGASGQSAAVFDEVLGASGDARTDAVNALTTVLARDEGDPAAVQADELPEVPVVHVANQVVVDDDQTIAPPFLDRLVAAYGAGVLVTDLATDTGTKDLDAWVNKHTGGLVEKSAITPDPQLVMVLQNAIALAAAWEDPFAFEGTHDEPFTLATGEQVSVPTMNRGGDRAYAERDGWRALRLPYTSDLHADLILPPEGSPEAGDPASADPALVAALVADLDAARPSRVLFSLPKLDLTSTLELLPVLDAMGLGHLLDPDTAGLDGLLVDPPAPPYVGQAFQQAVLKVDEEGTRAAAVTELGVEAGSAPVFDVELFVDRPFLFVVGDGESGWPLLLASILDPRG